MNDNEKEEKGEQQERRSKTELKGSERSLSLIIAFQWRPRVHTKPCRAIPKWKWVDPDSFAGLNRDVTLLYSPDLTGEVKQNRELTLKRD